MSRINDGHDLIQLLTDGAVTDLNAFTSKRTGGSNGNPEAIFYHKEWRIGGAAQTAPNAAAMHSMFTSDGIPSGGSVPTVWANPTNVTPGGLQQIDPGGGRKKWMHALSGASMVAGTLIFYDRLGHMGGLDGTVTTAQNTNGGAAGGVTRYTTGEYNELWIEIYTAIGVTARTITASYTDQGGSASTSLATPIGAAGWLEAGRIIPLCLASGDYGVRDVTSVTLSASTGTAGNFGVTIARPLCAVVFGIAGGMTVYWANGVIPEIKTDACIAMAWFANSVSPPIWEGLNEFVEA